MPLPDDEPDNVEPGMPLVPAVSRDESLTVTRDDGVLTSESVIKNFS